MNETLKALAAASNWDIPDDQIEEIASLYNGTMEDTRPVRALDLGLAGPAIVYEAGQE